MQYSQADKPMVISNFITSWRKTKPGSNLREYSQDDNTHGDKPF
jgi:hypothetical protein